MRRRCRWRHLETATGAEFCDVASRAAGACGLTPPDLSPCVTGRQLFEPHLSAHWKRAGWPYFYAVVSMSGSLDGEAQDRDPSKIPSKSSLYRVTPQAVNGRRDSSTT